MSDYKKADYLEAFGTFLVSDDLALDTDGRGRAKVSQGSDGGAWVRAWVWVGDWQVESLQDKKPADA